MCRSFVAFNIVQWARNFFLFILHGSKKIVKKFQAKIQSGTWPKYSLKNKKFKKKSKILRFSLQCTIVWAAVYSQLLTIPSFSNEFNLLLTIIVCNENLKILDFFEFWYFSNCILAMFQTVFWPEFFLQFSLTHVG